MFCFVWNTREQALDVLHWGNHHAKEAACLVINDAKNIITHPGSRTQGNLRLDLRELLYFFCTVIKFIWVTCNTVLYVEFVWPFHLLEIGTRTKGEVEGIVNNWKQCLSVSILLCHGEIPLVGLKDAWEIWGRGFVLFILTWALSSFLFSGWPACVRDT